MRLSLALFVLIVTVATARADVPDFERIEVPAHTYDGGWQHFVGGGVATFDCNGDQLPELYAAGGSNLAQLFRNTSKEKVSFRVDTPESLSIKGVTGAYPLDINSDGLIDLAILRVGHDLLMRGEEDCHFSPFETVDFESGDHWTTAFSATWENSNALPTLAFGTYVDLLNPKGPFEACDSILLYRPSGSTYHPPLRLSPSYCTLSILFSDWRRTGQADLRVSNDRHYYVRGGQEQLWKMDIEPSLYSSEDGWLSYSIWGMGIASRDITGNGFPDVYLTSMGDQKLQIFDPSSGGPVWRDATYEQGTTAHRSHLDGRPSTGWHAQFGDVNNDGLDDIFVAKGNVDQMPDAAMDDPNTLLLQQDTSRFIEVGREAGIASMARSRGAALVDMNNDGWLDLVVVNRRAKLEVYQNKAAQGNWLLVDLGTNGINRQAIGSFLEVKVGQVTHTREITIGGGHAGGGIGLHHFGVGFATEVELRVIWYDGEISPFRTFPVNQIISLRR